MMQTRDAPESAMVFRVFLAIALLTVVARAVYFTGEPLGWAAASDNDDIMRLLSVRGLLDGQGWFDMHQYRMMPPEGIDMHWSRYIDAAIAGLVTLFSTFLPPLQAENIAIVVWPTALLAVLVVLTGEATRRVFGASAAILAILSLLLWPPVGLGNFAPYRIDHHNVQIVMISVMVFCLIVPGRPVTLGLLGGLAGAVSFAIGMEMLIVIGLVGLILAGRTVLRAPGAGDQILAFSLALWLGSLVLFAGQTAPAEWTLARCDELSPPFLALTGMAALASFALARVVAPQPALRTRVILTLAISAAAAAALFPLLSPCLRGPYADLPIEAQTLIHARINEAQGLLKAIETGSDTPIRLFVPALIGVLIACAAFAFRIRHGLATAGEKRAVGTLLVFAALGLVGSLSQIRMLLLAAPAIPVLTGYGLTMMLGSGARAGLAGAARSLAAVAAMLATIFLPLLDLAVREAGAAPSPEEELVGCRSRSALSTLAQVPKGLVLAPVDFGGSLILLTPHDAVAGPYHRSAQAFLNGFVPFDGDEATLREAMRQTGADYLLLCRDLPYGHGDSMAHELAHGAQVDWLEPVPGVHPELVLLRRTAD
jgi:hypothetical protein